MIHKTRVYLGLLLGFAASAHAADVNFAANLGNYTTAPASAYLNLVLVNCGVGNIPIVAGGLKAGTLQPTTAGLVAAKVTPNADITCGAVVGGTRYRIEVRRKLNTTLPPSLGSDPVLASAEYVVGPGDFDLTTASPVSPVPAPAASIDFSSYAATRPFRRLAFASFPATCTTLKDWIERSDPATAGQVLYHCNAAGTGWDLTGGGGSGGSMTWPAAAGIAVYGGSSAWGTSITWNSGTSTITGNITGNAGGTAAALAAQYVDWNAGSGGASIQNKPTLGTAAAKNIPATGDASATEVVYGSDTRLTNARTPSAHASSHQNGGGDEIATATAGANAIPKAGAGGTLGTAWIPDLSATYLPLHSTADLAAGLSAQYVDWNVSSGGTSIANRPTLATVAISGTYADLTGKPATVVVLQKSASYLATSADMAAFIVMDCSSCTLTLPATNPGDSWQIALKNANASALTIAPNGLNLNGSAGNATIYGGGSSFIISQGGAYFSAALNAKVALTGAYADLGGLPTLGTAAAKNIPATGDASATEVVYGSDTRLTNARAPSAHASSHQNGGGDEIATATAGANAIPKAGAGGTLGTAWIPDLSATYLPLHSTADLAAGLSAQYTDWGAGSGGASIANKPTLGTAAAKNVLGTGTNVATTSASAPASNKCVEFDTSGNLVIAGSNGVCSSGGSMTWPAAAGIAVYGGASAWGSSLTAPSGAIVGTSDTQTLGNKSFSTPITVGTAAGAIGQVNLYQGPNAGANIGHQESIRADWSALIFNVPDGNVVMESAVDEPHALAIQESAPPWGRIHWWFDGSSAGGTGGWFAMQSPVNTLNFNFRLLDTAGASKFRVVDSNLNEKFSVNSLGQVSVNGGTAALPMLVSTAVASTQMPAFTGDVTTSAGAVATTLANIPTAVPMAGSVVAANIAAPASPAAAHVSLFADSTDLRLHDKNASGVIGTTVVADSGAANNFLTAVSAAGAISKARPTWANVDKTTSSVADITTRTCATLSDSASGCSTAAYSLPTATSSVLGGVKPDGTSILNTAGAISVTPTSVGLSAVTNDAQTKAAVVPNTAPAAGQVPCGNAGGTAYAPCTIGTDATMTSTGALTLRTGLNIRTCEIHIWGTGTSSALQATDDEIVSCKNKYGVTWTLTSIECWANAGTTTTVQPQVTGGSSTGLVTGAITCGNASFVSGTMAATPTVASNATIDINVGVADASTTNIRVVIAGTI